MSTPWQRVHEKLLAQLPVRTHRAQGGESSQKHDIGNRRQIPKHHKAGRPIIYRGVKYRSISYAVKVLKLHPREVYRLLQVGKAQYTEK